MTGGPAFWDTREPLVVRRRDCQSKWRRMLAVRSNKLQFIEPCVLHPLIHLVSFCRGCSTSCGQFFAFLCGGSMEQLATHLKTIKPNKWWLHESVFSHKLDIKVKRVLSVRDQLNSFLKALKLGHAGVRGNVSYKVICRTYGQSHMTLLTNRYMTSQSLPSLSEFRFAVFTSQLQFHSPYHLRRVS